MRLASCVVRGGRPAGHGEGARRSPLNVARSTAPWCACALAGCFSFGGAADTPYNRGVDAFDQRRYPDAVRWFRRAHELEPDDPRPLVNLGITFDRLGHAAPAEAAYRQALALAPEEPRALANLGALLGEQGQREAARALLARAAEVEPSSAFPWIALGWFEERAGNGPEAERLYRIAIAAEPGSANGHYRLGRLLATRGDAEGGRAALRAALAAEAEDVDALRALLELVDHAGADGEGLALLRRLVLLAPEDGDAWLALGRAFLATGDPERAAMALWQARDRSGGAPARRAAVAEALRLAYARLQRDLPAAGGAGDGVAAPPQAK